MERSSDATVNRAVRGVLLVGIGVSLLVLGDGVLDRFLSQAVSIRTMIGAVVLVVLGTVEVWRVVSSVLGDSSTISPHTHHVRDGGTNESGGHAHSSGAPLWALLLPLVMVPAALNSSSAAIAQNRLFVGQAGARPAPERIDAPAAPTVPTAPPVAADGALPNVVNELLPTAGTDGVYEYDSMSFSLLPYVATLEPDRVLGNRVRMTGFVFRENDWPEGNFVLGRLAIWCCAADASLVGMWISVDDPGPRNGEWLEVEGTVGLVDHLPLGNRSLEGVPSLYDVTYRPVSAPEDEYTPAPLW